MSALPFLSNQHFSEFVLFSYGLPRDKINLKTFQKSQNANKTLTFECYTIG